MRPTSNVPVSPVTVRPWHRHHPAEQAGILLDLAQQTVIGGMATQSHPLRHAFNHLREPARYVAGYLLAVRAPNEPGPRPPWRWADLHPHQQRTMLKAIAEWSVHEWTAHRERPPEVRHRFRELSRNAFAVYSRLTPRQRETAR